MSTAGPAPGHEHPMVALDAIVALVHAGRRFLVTGHARPDGDALGSMLATAHGLRALGKEVVVYDRDPAPPRLDFLPGAAALTTTPPTEPFDVTFVHDCGDAHLLGPDFPPPAVTGTMVVLDHHASARPFGDLLIRDPSASAVGVIVARLLAALGVPLSREIGECLWCSLVCDTGWFRYSATDLETMRLATSCVEVGVVPWDFARRSEEAQPPARLKLMARVFDTLEIVGTTAIITLATATLDELGAHAEWAEGLVSYARGLAGVEVGVMFFEQPDGVRVSLRSKGALDVGAVAERFGGGGHRAAAGCFVRGDLATARRQLLALLELP
jgi:bifunctional oligoribonuclease and PAP phosphatase NrnA